jgi:hypothetical protein
VRLKSGKATRIPTSTHKRGTSTFFIGPPFFKWKKEWFGNEILLMFDVPERRGASRGIHIPPGGFIKAL